MENTAVLNVRISEQLKQKLEELAKLKVCLVSLTFVKIPPQSMEQDETVSDLVREILETAVTQDSDNVSGIPPDLMERIRAEAQRRNIPTPLLITILLRMAVEGLRKTRGTRLVQW